MRIYLIRHGQSENNLLHAQGTIGQRKHDPKLTDAGEQQAQHVGRYISESHDMPSPVSGPFELTHLYCSPMERAMQTAQPIADALNMQPEIWVDTHEIGGLFLSSNNGAVNNIPGLNRRQIETQFPGFVLPDEITAEGWWDMQSVRETPAGFTSRAIRVAFALRERAHTDERVALVTHAVFIDALIKVLMNQAPIHPKTLFYNHYNTGITRIDLGRDGAYMTQDAIVDRMRIHYLNRVNHLPSELWTW